MSKKIELTEFAEPFLESTPDLIAEEAEVNVNEQIEPDPAIAIGTYVYKGESIPIPFGSYGDFSCIVGASKSMKTKLKMALVAGYIGGKAQNYFPDFKGIKSTGRYVLDIDTEQSRFHVKRMRTDILDMVGVKDHQYLKTFALRKYSPAERYRFLEWLAYKSDYAGRIGVIIVDGAADLIDDTNDLVQSSRLANLFMKITEEQDCHLITILHRTKSSNKPTGHIGSAVLKKAETVAFVERDNLSVSVKPQYTRNYPFHPFSFTLDEDYLPIDESVNDDIL